MQPFLQPSVLGHGSFYDRDLGDCAGLGLDEIF